MLATIQKELGLPVKWILVGTRNRWFHETCEAERLVELRLSIEEFQRRRQPGEGRRPSGDDDDDDDSLVVPDKLEDEDFDRLDKYVTSVKPFTVLSKFLGGEKYPTGGSVIPALEQIKEDVENMKNEEEDDEAKRFLQNILTSMNSRFKDNWIKKAPYNCLTFLDPRNINIYCLEPHVFEKIVSDIKYDSVYEEDAANHPLQTLQAGSSTIFPIPTEANDKRARLLKRKLETSNFFGAAPAGTFDAKLEEEINR